MLSLFSMKVRPKVLLDVTFLTFSVRMASAFPSHSGAMDLTIVSMKVTNSSVVCQ